MPTNLPPEYFAAEKKFRQTLTPREKISALEELISTVPKHKGTDKLRADLRKKLSQLRDEAVSMKRSGKGDLYAVEKQGAAQVALAGFANAGKSSIVKVLTNAHPVIAEYPMSTVAPLSGMMPFEDIQFQFIDLPPLGNESTDGWVSAILRNADLLLLMADLSKDPAGEIDMLIAQLLGWKLRLLQREERKKEEEGFTAKPAILVGNMADLPGAAEGIEAMRRNYGSSYPVAAVSAARKDGLEALKRIVFACSRIIRVYSKEPGRPPDRNAPFVLPSGATVVDLAEIIHRDFVKNLKYACIWGSAKFDGQRVQRDFVLSDRDVVELHIK